MHLLFSFFFSPSSLILIIPPLLVLSRSLPVVTQTRGGATWQQALVHSPLRTVGCALLFFAARIRIFFARRVASKLATINSRYEYDVRVLLGAWRRMEVGSSDDVGRVAFFGQVWPRS